MDVEHERCVEELAPASIIKGTRLITGVSLSESDRKAKGVELSIS